MVKMKYFFMILQMTQKQVNSIIKLSSDHNWFMVHGQYTWIPHNDALQTEVCLSIKTWYTYINTYIREFQKWNLSTK